MGEARRNSFVDVRVFQDTGSVACVLEGEEFGVGVKYQATSKELTP